MQESLIRDRNIIVIANYHRNRNMYVHIICIHVQSVTHVYIICTFMHITDVIIIIM